MGKIILTRQLSPFFLWSWVMTTFDRVLHFVKLDEHVLSLHFFKTKADSGIKTASHNLKPNSTGAFADNISIVASESIYVYVLYRCSVEKEAVPLGRDQESSFPFLTGGSTTQNNYEPLICLSSTKLKLGPAPWARWTAQQTTGKIQSFVSLESAPSIFLSVLETRTHPPTHLRLLS